MLQGPYGGSERDKPLARIPFTVFLLGTVFLPFAGLITCVVLSLICNYTEATYTHCQEFCDPSDIAGNWGVSDFEECFVDNYLPSISAAISLTPQRYIWRFCIGLHSAPRFLIATTYFNFYRGRFAKQIVEQILNAFTLLCAISENAGLLLLTYVCSTETYSLHKNGFITFLASSVLHMLCTCRLWYVISKYTISTEEMTSYRSKVRLFLFNIIIALAAGYFFRRHNKYCEPGIYTIFAVCEYLVVLSNIAFHMTAYWDFGSRAVMVAMPVESKYI